MMALLMLTSSLAGCFGSNENDVQENDSQTEPLIQEIASLNEKISEQEIQISSFVENLGILNSEISNLENELSSLQGSQNSSEEEKNAKIAELETARASLNSTIIELNSQIEQFQQTLNQRDQSIVEYIELVGIMQLENVNLSLQIVDMNQIIEDLQSTIVELQSALYPYSCPDGSSISSMVSDSIYANPGVVFSNYSEFEDHDPLAIQFQVTLNGSPLEGCEVRFEIEDDNGWFFPAYRQTNNDGMIYGYWTAGSIIGGQNMSAYITSPSGEKMYHNLSGEVSDVRLIAASIHSKYQFSGEFEQFSIRATPGTGPQGTYYSTINWKGSYGGLQFVDSDTTMVIFSTWDTNGRDAEIVDNGSCNEITGFGGEGTGVSCRIRLPPSDYGGVDGLPDDYMLVTGHTYETSIEIQDCGTNCQAYTFLFEDITRGFGPISLGTQQYKSDSINNVASSFVEDFYRYGNCIDGYQGESAERSILYHDIRALVNGQWEHTTQSTFNAIYDGWPEEICGNYYSERTESGFFLSSGGDRFVGPPIISGDSYFPSHRAIE